VLPSADSVIDGAARIRHPNVALVSDLGRTVQKFCSGYPLRNGIDEKDLSPSLQQTAPMYLRL